MKRVNTPTNSGPTISQRTAPTTKAWMPWSFVPSLYFAEGIPYVVVMTVSVIMYKRMGVSNTDIALYTSWLYLPWVIKPLWSPIVDVLKTKRFWIYAMQLVIGAGLGGVALTIPAPDFLKYTLLFFWLLAFSSATHDIAADGFYMLALSERQQAWFVGVRSTFYRLAMITGQGLLIILAGFLEIRSGLPPANLTVSATPRAVTRPLNPDSLTLTRDGGELRIMAYPASVEISSGNTRQSAVDSILSLAKHWNATHGFYPGVDPASTAPAFLDKRASADQPAGNFGVAFLYLSGSPTPGSELVVNFGFDDGDKSIVLVEGSRFVINERNWKKPFMAVLQLDPKLKSASSAVFQARAGNVTWAWSVTFVILAIMFAFFALYHRFMLPRPASDAAAVSSGSLFSDFIKTLGSFFKRKHIGVILAFLLLYRFAEAQLVKLASPFLLDGREVGGLALTTGEVGFVYGTVGIIALTLGGLLGGFVVAQQGLKYWLWWMVAAINLPNLVYVYLSSALPDGFVVINACVAIEQFGYGFGFTAYMLYMIYVSEGKFKTAHFAICTGFMALGMMVPGMFSGWIQDQVGYQNFFLWIMLATLPAFAVCKFIPLDPEFGKKN